MVRSNMFFDLMRGGTLFIAAALVVYCAGIILHWRSVPYDLPRKLRYLALFGYASVTAIDQWQQLGEPVTWRCPLLFFVSFIALFGMALPDVYAWSDVHEFDSPADKYKHPDR